MTPTVDWERGPISGRLILYVDRALWPRAEVIRTTVGDFAAILFMTAEDGGAAVGRFALAIEAQLAAEDAMRRAIRTPDVTDAPR